MKAVIQTGGKQYIVSLGQKIKVEKIDKKIGEIVKFENVLLSFDNELKKVEVGQPNVKQVVEGKVLEQGKGEKVIIFKYKPKKRYKVKKGHRQLYTLIEITKIGDKSISKKEKETSKKATPKKETKKVNKEELKKEAKTSEKEEKFFN